MGNKIKCPTCNTDLESSSYEITNGGLCPYCGGEININNQKFPDRESGEDAIFFLDDMLGVL
uniref:Uncharacterized protein n=1 Tax=viral metagenome TaxID=1070528 RepID=A0A6M3JKJ1_9ZZZZ